MKSKLFFLLFSILMTLLYSKGFSDLEEYEKGEKLKVNPSRLHPTQFLYSHLEVESKIKELKEIMDELGEEGVIEYLKNHRGQVVVGPGNKMWVVDGHHHARALDILKNSDERFREVSFYVKVLHEWNELSPKEFEKSMKLGNKHGDKDGSPLVYLKDLKGKTQSFKKLPKKLSSMKDSPYRSLVWLLKEEGAIEEIESIPFQEFLIAEYLQAHIKLPSKMTPRAYKKALRDALDLIENADPDDFPGYKKIKTVGCAKILKNISGTKF